MLTLTPNFELLIIAKQSHGCDNLHPMMRTCAICRKTPLSTIQMRPTW